jgi:hypothetical protein
MKRIFSSVKKMLPEVELFPPEASEFSPPLCSQFPWALSLTKILKVDDSSKSWDVIVHSFYLN